MEANVARVGLGAWANVGGGKRRVRLGRLRPVGLVGRKGAFYLLFSLILAMGKGPKNLLI